MVQKMLLGQKSPNSTPNSPEAIKECSDSPEVIKECSNSPEAIKECSDSPEAIKECSDSPDALQESPDSPDVLQESPDSPEAIKECSESQDKLQESPDSPDAIKESPDSPEAVQESPEKSYRSGDKSIVCLDDDQEEGEILFIEDRRPGSISPSFNVQIEKSPVLEDYISLNSNKGMYNNSNKGMYNKACENINKSVHVIDIMEDELDFVEDRNPLLSNHHLTESPLYNIKTVYLSEESPGQNKGKKRSWVNNCCWNCGDDTHALRDCPLPRDSAQIARSRKEFLESKPVMPVYKRYHVEDTQKFGHLVPGELSAELRSALGLEPQQLPTHIYMMRRVGYPPGWLQEARISHSGISIIDSHGDELLAAGMEGGEITEEGVLDKYDAHKIISYPGFNVPPPEDTYDDSRYWECPPMSQLQSVEVMLERLGTQLVGGYKRRKLTLNSTITSLPEETSECNESQDMEYEHVEEKPELPVDSCGFVPSLPDEEVPPPPPPEEVPPTDINETSDDVTAIKQLEEQKKQLLAELNDVSPVCGTPESRVGKIRSEDLGTPILKSVSPFRRLPSANKFSVNICDVINFENLPDSTGKYEQMSGIIRNVRTRLSDLNKEI